MNFKISFLLLILLFLIKSIFSDACSNGSGSINQNNSFFNFIFQENYTQINKSIIENNSYLNLSIMDPRLITELTDNDWIPIILSFYEEDNSILNFTDFILSSNINNTNYSGYLKRNSLSSLINTYPIKNILLNNYTFDVLNKKISTLNRNYIFNKLQYKNNVPVIIELLKYDQIDNMLSQLPDFKLDNTFDLGFYGNISLIELEYILKNDNVLNIYYNFRTKPLLEQSTVLINSDNVWLNIYNNLNLTGQYQIVCIVDTGVNYSHQDLGNCTTSEFINGQCKKVIGGYDFVSNDEDPMDEDGHGTLVAGAVVANGSLKGVSFGANIVAVRGVGGDLVDGRNAINWCINNRETFNISIISLSFAVSDEEGNELLNSSICDNWDILVRAANNASNYGLLVIAGSGNSASFSSMTSPACGSNVTSVGAVYDEDLTDYWNVCGGYYNGHSDQVTCYSNRNIFTDIFAPGSFINSTNIYGNYSLFMGTSMAAPHVAGVAALMKQANNSLTPFDIRSIMVRTGVSVYDPNSTLAFPRVDAYRSVMAGIYDNFVSDTELVYSDNNRKVISFNVFNDLNQTSGMGWNLSLGNNITRANNSIANLGAYDDLMVFVEYNYTTSGDYVINSTLGTNWQAIPITVNKEIDIINDSVLCAGCNNRRVFTYNLTSYYGNQVADWSVDFGDGITSSSLNNFTILENQTIFFFIEHNYSTAQEYLISAEISSTAMKEYANNMTANITQLD